jgi:hypothetical protein
MGRIRLGPTGDSFKRKVEDWLQTLNDQDLDHFAVRRDQLFRQMEQLYQSMYPPVQLQS